MVDKISLRSSLQGTLESGRTTVSRGSSSRHMYCRHVLAQLFVGLWQPKRALCQGTNHDFETLWLEIRTLYFPQTHKIRIRSDFWGVKNLVYKKKNWEKIMRWCFHMRVYSENLGVIVQWINSRGAICSVVERVQFPDNWKTVDEIKLVCVFKGRKLK